MKKTTQKARPTNIIVNSARSLLCSNLSALFAGLALGILITQTIATDDLGSAYLIAYFLLPLSLVLTFMGNHFRKKDTVSENAKRRAKRSGK